MNNVKAQGIANLLAKNENSIVIGTSNNAGQSKNGVLIVAVEILEI